MFNGSNCDRKSQLSGILTETLNPRISFTVPFYLSFKKHLPPKKNKRERREMFMFCMVKLELN